MKRHDMRKYAFMLIFERIFIEDSISEIIETAKQVEEIKINDNIEKMFSGTQAHVGEIDDIIKKYLKKWDIKRITKVSLAVLRLAVYEIVFDNDIPTSIAIDEAIELMKEFSTQEDASFVNGVLGSFARELDKQEEE